MRTVLHVGLALCLFATAMTGRAPLIQYSVATSPLNSGVKSIPPAEGAQVGVAHPVVVTFNGPINPANRAGAERSVAVTSMPAMTGHYEWLASNVVQWVPDHYWPAHSTIALSVGGRFAEFKTGPAVVGVADISDHTFTVTIDGMGAGSPIPLPSPALRAHAGDQCGAIRLDFLRQRVRRDTARRRLDRVPSRQRVGKRRRRFGLDTDQSGTALIPGRDAADQAAAADSYQHSVQRWCLMLELEADRCLPEHGLRLVKGVDRQRPAVTLKVLARGESVGVAITDHPQRGAIGRNQLPLARRADAGHENRCLLSHASRGISNRAAMIAAGRRDDTGCGNLAREQMGERTTRLERSGVLQIFLLEHEGDARQAEVIAIDLQHRRLADVTAQPLRRLTYLHCRQCDGHGCS